MQNVIQSYTDLYEDMGWELPPVRSEERNPVEHYYHYPGVTLGVHRVENNVIRYERIVRKIVDGKKITTVKVYPIEIPKKLSTEEAVQLTIGDEKLAITCPQRDEANRFVYVTVLFCSQETVKSSCECKCSLADGNIQKKPLMLDDEDTTTGTKRVHFAPLVAVRYQTSTVV